MESQSLPIEVSQVEIFPVQFRNGLIAFGSAVITIGDRICYSIANVAVYTRADGNGYRLVYPSKRDCTGREIHSFRPLNQESNLLIEKAILGRLEYLSNKIKNHNVKNTQKRIGENEHEQLPPLHFR